MAKENLLLLPGMMCDDRLFQPQLERFGADHDVRVGALTGAASIQDLAQTVLDSAPPGMLNVAGLSMGGIVAMEMMRIAPERIARLALLDTNHLADSEERVALRNRQIASVEAGNLRQVVVDEMKPNYLARQHRADTELLNLLIAMALSLGKQAFIDQSYALRDRRDQSDTLARIPVPTLVLFGEEDTLCTPQRHREMAALIADARLVPVEQAGHISTLENPDAVNDALQMWLNS